MIAPCRKKDSMLYITRDVVHIFKMNITDFTFYPL